MGKIRGFYMMGNQAKDKVVLSNVLGHSGTFRTVCGRANAQSDFITVLDILDPPSITVSYSGGSVEIAATNPSTNYELGSNGAHNSISCHINVEVYKNGSLIHTMGRPVSTGGTVNFNFTESPNVTLIIVALVGDGYSNSSSIMQQFVTGGTLADPVISNAHNYPDDRTEFTISNPNSVEVTVSLSITNSSGGSYTQYTSFTIAANGQWAENYGPPVSTQCAELSVMFSAPNWESSSISYEIS